jgi:hypothetical protein
MESKKMIIGLFGLISLLITSTRLGQAAPSNTLPLEISIQDESGAPVSDTHLFIFSNDSKQLVLTREVDSHVHFDLPPGDYRLYAAMTEQDHGYIEHYSSPESTLHLPSADPASVILSVRKADDSEIYLSETALKKLHIDQALANYLN